MDLSWHLFGRVNPHPESRRPDFSPPPGGRIGVLRWHPRRRRQPRRSIGVRRRETLKHTEETVQCPPLKSPNPTWDDTATNIIYGTLQKGKGKTPLCRVSLFWHSCFSPFERSVRKTKRPPDGQKRKKQNTSSASWRRTRRRRFPSLFLATLKVQRASDKGTCT